MVKFIIRFFSGSLAENAACFDTSLLARIVCREAAATAAGHTSYPSPNIDFRDRLDFEKPEKFCSLPPMTTYGSNTSPTQACKPLCVQAQHEAVESAEALLNTLATKYRRKPSSSPSPSFSTIDIKNV